MSKFDLTPRKNLLAPLITLNLDCQEYAADLEAQAQLQMEAEALHCACLAKNEIGISLYTQQWFCDSATRGTLLHALVIVAFITF